MKLKAFPKEIYVKQETDGEDTYLVASADPSTLVDAGFAVPAAKYALVQAGVVIESKVQVSVRGRV